MDDYLMHYGVLGMKWGIRKYQNEDGSLTEAGKQHYSSKYSPEQIRRDRKVYGNRGVERINKRMKYDLDSISGARSAEADRISKARRTAVVTGNIGRTLGSIAGGVGGYVIGKKVVSKYVNDPVVSSLAAPAIATGMASIGNYLGSTLGKNAGMNVYGYKGNKFRYS